MVGNKCGNTHGFSVGETTQPPELMTQFGRLDDKPRPYGQHTPMAPSGRELSAELTEGECVTTSK